MDCKICLKKIPDNILLHLKHLKLYHPFEVTYKCIYEKCCRNFSSFGALKKHLNICSFKMHVSQNPTDIKSIDDSSLHTSVIFKDLKSISGSNSSINANKSVFEQNSEAGVISNSILKFVALLYNKPNISRSLVQKIIEEFQDTIQNVSDYFFQQLKTILPPEIHHSLNNVLEVSIFDNINSDNINSDNINTKGLNISKNLNTLSRRNHFLLGNCMIIRKNKTKQFSPCGSVKVRSCPCAKP